MLEDLIVSSLAGLATAVGALIVILFKKIGEKFIFSTMGFAAGIMIAVSTLELIPEAAELGGNFNTALGFTLGVILMYLLDIFVPHSHIGSGEMENDEKSKFKKMGYFIFLGIALHNLPEGLAIGAGFEAQKSLGMSIAIALAIHNVPEGMATAVPLLAGGVSKLKVVILTLIAGMMTPIGTFIGMLLFQISESFIAIGLSLAAGAMIYIVSDELIPHSHSGHSHWGNFGLLLGFLLGFLIL
ncbi:ZIP family metal transporter [Anaerobranca gottschalkii]|uniref:Zinc transporter, ZIP family n=1 Tax=Anaerobranca gottschalkii DSM 13577 TaxID=1120990 RepID=A0A1I0CN78_9FIRM|nr:ZIP family metal transporter [Anaerobranca gottschalkii]SET21150.1 zinc transporter, ZIP family [Anaerobranca gottschalkii DSM 13577]